MKKIALAQTNIIYGDFKFNVQKAEKFVQSAIDQHCDLILFPELWSSGFDLKNNALYDVKNISLIQKLQSIADQNNISICGSYIQNQDAVFYNAFNFIQPNKPIQIYHKSHLFTLMHEDKFFQPGIITHPISSILGTTGLGICFDLRFPEYFRELYSQGVQVFLISSHWPLVRIDHWDILLQARAIENQAFVIAANSTGLSGKDMYGGHSTVIAPDGKVLLRAPSNVEDLFIVEIDPSEVQSVREKFVIQR